METLKTRTGMTRQVVPVFVDLQAGPVQAWWWAEVSINFLEVVSINLKPEFYVSSRRAGSRGKQT